MKTSSAHAARTRHVFRPLPLAAFLLAACTAETSDMRPAPLPDRVERLVDECRRSHPDARWVSLDEWERLSADDDATLLVDVRSPDEQRVSAIPGALTVADYEALPDDVRRDATVLTYQPVAKVIPRGTAPLTPGASFPDLDESTDSPAIRRLAHDSIDTVPHESTSTTGCYAKRWAVVPDGYETVY